MNKHNAHLLVIVIVANYGILSQPIIPIKKLDRLLIMVIHRKKTAVSQKILSLTAKTCSVNHDVFLI